MACLSVTALSGLMSACSGSRYINGTLRKDGLTIYKKDFELQQRDSTAYASFIIVRNNALKFPICVYRHGDEDYTAIWMKCSHQGAELQASGDMLQCSAHGSEFDHRGKLVTGPATIDLRTFPITVRNGELFIDLRKIS